MLETPLLGPQDGSHLYIVTTEWCYPIQQSEII